MALILIFCFYGFSFHEDMKKNSSLGGVDKCDNYLLFTLIRTSELSFIHVFCVNLMKEFRNL